MGKSVNCVSTFQLACCNTYVVSCIALKKAPRVEKFCAFKTCSHFMNIYADLNYDCREIK